ncbi:cadherin-like protein 26 [Plectropomus leopardus]|uniref:cadherin-like protein 26 n=1 Tax=Plectropomus leopardus TaxID=160734 RepID=UPI001C4B9315|nr:cadherin-like protein 26 [Plectropomus leopardus]
MEWTKMGTFFLLLLLALTALAECHRGYYSRRDKREALVRSKRRWVLSTIEIQEEDTGPFPKQISQMFNDQTHHEGEKYRISGMGVTEPPLGVFEINENNGVVYALRPVDREQHNLFNIKFDILSKQSGKVIDKELAFIVEVLDINDNAPQFEVTQMEADVMENMQDDLPVHLLVKDIDQWDTPNAEVTISVLSQNPKTPTITLKQINNRIAKLTVDGCFDYDKIKKYEVVVGASDHGTPSLSSTAVVTLNIVDSNSHQPTFKAKEYHGEVMEATTKSDVLRIAVDDKDTPNTPGWRAKYYFIKGNEGENYKIETDPKTNEGILSVIKGKDYEKTTNTTLQIGVKNEEDIFYCKNKAAGGTDQPPPEHTVNIIMKVIDINDPPQFDIDKSDVYQQEEEAPGKLLFTPKVTDVDSVVSKIRYVLLKDPADWVKVDEKTGKVTTTKKMDRESPFVDESNIYTVIVGAIDDGEPPATGTATVLIHLRDINDNMPRLVNKSIILCGNKGNKVMVPATDADARPYSGPFAFSLGSDDKTLSERWKLEPAFGEECGLVSRKTLAYGNYSVPLEIQDQQGVSGHGAVEVMVCDCQNGDVCRNKEPATARLGQAAIGLFFLGLLLFLLLLLVFLCQCGKKDFKHIPILQDEGNQTLIKYNQEGGGSECKMEPTLLLTPTNGVNVTDGIKTGTMKMSQTAPAMAQYMEAYDSSGLTMMNSMTSMGMQRQRDTLRSQGGGQAMYSAWTTSRSNTYQGNSSQCGRSYSLRSSHNISDHINRRLHVIEANHVDHPVYVPYEYGYEGQGSKCQSLDKLSLSNLGDDMMFLNDLGPKFKTLGTICHQTVKEKNIQL